MKHIIFSLISVIILPAFVFALDKIVTVEGPVRIVDTTPAGTTYYIESPEKIQYKVIVPPSESDKFAVMIKESPKAVVRFDGTVVNNEGTQILNVQKWQRVTRTTTTTDLEGNTVQEKTTTLEKR